ncbi:MAG: hypothetical protein M3R13_06215 [Armatimonadota bacterium]|nr:hypothetical protein [Armatimonadota bacterium]
MYPLKKRTGHDRDEQGDRNTHDGQGKPTIYEDHERRCNQKQEKHRQRNPHMHPAQTFHMATGSGI